MYPQCSSNERNPKVPHRDDGISNFGNTFFINACLQYKCSKVPNIRTAAFVGVIQSVFRTPDEDIGDEGLHAYGNKQEDALELLLFLLQNLEDDFLSPFV
ncbi:Ubiquitin carboxyl-terminal hydrolase 43 [Frankliniella fusca]|uniref:Ubiquitin carboxyl-terminal hydrolase 43 n=1 Tax=Frankliniella fusca TaxID=407009 RepID=A0AAE1GQS2_9NEOP|nr:Ubiquitin carboxyl-terminal hydrolase 43 [Frankliniella fusca]